MKRMFWIAMGLIFVLGACSPAIEQTPPDYEAVKKKSDDAFREMKKEERKDER